MTIEERIQHIERFDREINAIVVRDFERARANAPLDGPLRGRIVTVKESFDVAGLPTTWGVPKHRANIAREDSDVAARLRAAGAILIGKTNVSQMLADFECTNEVYGSTNNPWDLARVPGGSSGGSAAALACGFTEIDVGTDLGGSIRNPAHYCGVYAHKPTFDLVSLRGHRLPNFSPPLDLAVAGPMARTAEDLATTLEVLTDSRLAPAKPVRRVAFWSDSALAPVDEEIRARMSALAARLADAGIVVSETARPDFEPDDYRQAYREHVFRGVASPLREDFDAAWARFFRAWDVLVCPVATTTAYRRDQKPEPYFAHVFWSCLATLCHLPATAFPTGRSDSGLPIGLQAIGPLRGDRTTIEFARVVGAPCDPWPA